MTTTCYCGNATALSRGSGASSPSTQQPQKLMCQPCASRRLSTQIAQYRSAKSRHDVERVECHRRLSETRLLCRPTTSDDDDGLDGNESSSTRRVLPDPNQINEQVSRLKDQLDALRSQSNGLAVRLTAKTMENDEREEALQTNSAKVHLAQERLNRMRQCLLDEGLGVEEGTRMGGGVLRDALISGTQEIQSLRFHFACQVFDMHRLDVGELYSNSKDGEAKICNNEGATGVGKIGGLPLPHAGPVLYGVIPPVLLASSLRLVASLTQLVARCLGVVLPHPILVCFKECHSCGSMYDFGSDVIDVSSNFDSGRDDSDNDNGYLRGNADQRNWCSACLTEGMTKNAPTKSPPRPIPQSQDWRRSSLLAIVGSSARKVVSLTTSATSRAISHIQLSTSTSTGAAIRNGSQQNYQFNPNANSQNNTSDTYSILKGSFKSVSMSPTSISRRIQHASFAYLRESHDTSATEYSLNPPRWGDDASAGGGGANPNKNQSGNNVNDAGTRPPTNRMTLSNREEFHVAEERFATGLQLLQNDIVALCFRAGVDISTLWPAESVLLNLHSLWRHCQQMADARINF